MLADAKQYKKALSEETGFDFDDKRYPKYHKETLEEMGYVIRNVCVGVRDIGYFLD